MQMNDFINRFTRNEDNMQYSSGNSGNAKMPPFRIGSIITVALSVMTIYLAVSSVYTIDPEEVGVVLRFGRYIRTSTPGLNFKIPLVESVKKVPVRRQLKEEFGYRTAKADVRSEYRTNEKTEAEALMLTGDLNCAVVEWIVQYKINDPVKYLFNVRNVRSTFRNMCEGIMREIIGDRSVSEVLTVGREEVGSEARKRLQQLCDRYETGIRVSLVVLQDVNPPDPVKPSYNEVNQSEQEKDRMINEAKADYNQIIPRAKGEAESTVRAAEGYALDRINRAKGDAERFDLVYKEYRQAKDVTRRRLYLETLTEVLKNAEKKIIVDEEQKGMIPLLQLGERGSSK
ncbi:MAG: FtsH protease activity modulator HflK [Chitinispirillaceae bacterium]